MTGIYRRRSELERRRKAGLIAACRKARNARGLMLAVEPHPEAGGARKYCYALKERGLLAKDTHGHTIRIAPPLVVTKGEIDWALE